MLHLLKADRQAFSLIDGDLARAAAAVLESDRVRSLVQRQIGPYRLLRLLGEGGMGVGYPAERTDIGGEVAIKLLRDAWLSPCAAIGSRWNSGRWPACTTLRLPASTMRAAWRTVRPGS